MDPINVADYSDAFDKEHIYMTFDDETSQISLEFGAPSTLTNELYITRDDRYFHDCFDYSGRVTVMKLGVCTTREVFDFVTKHLAKAVVLSTKPKNLWFKMVDMESDVEAAVHLYYAQKQWNSADPDQS
jgi:hypothetical protein